MKTNYSIYIAYAKNFTKHEGDYDEPARLNLL